MERRRSVPRAPNRKPAIVRSREAPQPVPCCPSGASTQQRNSQRCFLKLLSELVSSCESAKPLEKAEDASAFRRICTAAHAAPAAPAAGVALSLASQGSPLAGAQVSVSVQPYTKASVPASSGAPSSVALAAGVAAAAIVALASCILYYRAVRNHSASVSQ